jgi:periplasmic copper chaperone A
MPKNYVLTKLEVLPMRFFAALGAIVVSLAAFGSAGAHEASNMGITVAHPWVRATPGGSTIGAAYLEIKSEAGIVDRLVGATSPAAGRVEVHTHIKDGDVMRMRKVDVVNVPSGASHVLAPSGDHLMLMELKAPLKEGDLVPLTLTFEKAGAITVEATVEPVGAMGPHGMDHQPGHEMPAGAGHEHKH